MAAGWAGPVLRGRVHDERVHGLPAVGGEHGDVHQRHDVRMVAGLGDDGAADLKLLWDEGARVCPRLLRRAGFATGEDLRARRAAANASAPMWLKLS